jgi:hypothetical protein
MATRLPWRVMSDNSIKKKIKSTFLYPFQSVALNNPWKQIHNKNSNHSQALDFFLLFYTNDNEDLVVCISIR